MTQNDLDVFIYKIRSAHTDYNIDPNPVNLQKLHHELENAERATGEALENLKAG
jgi:hypothetical protein